MAGKPKSMFRVIFLNQGNVYELHARKVSQGALFAFVEVEEIVFGDPGKLLVDPSEERLKTEFAGVRRTFIPLPAIVRIDEVDKEGANKIIPMAGSPGNVTPFPLLPGPAGGKPGRG